MFNSKFFLVIFTVLFASGTSQAWADKLDSNGVLRKADGSIRYLTQPKAMKACPSGTHLPTIRELAEEAHANGSKEILELNQVNPQQVPDDYEKISAINSDGTQGEFYYNNDDLDGYEVEWLGSNWFWSSSIHSHPMFSDVDFYIYITAGELLTQFSDFSHAVRCFADR